MIKKLVVLCCGLIVLGVSVTAVAGNGGPPSKSQIYHCGCVTGNWYGFATARLEWSYLDVSHNSKGHAQHLDGDLEECFFIDSWGSPDSDDFVRNWDDCEDTGSDRNNPHIDSCDGGDNRPSGNPPSGTCGFTAPDS
jgi:hypothetical protein